MKQHAVAALFAAVAAPALAQITALPSCALQPALSAVGQTGCSATDVACICKNSAFIDSLAPEIQKDCSASDLQKALSAAENLCSSAGVTLSLPESTSAVIIGSSSATSSSAAAATTMAPARPVTTGLGEVGTASTSAYPSTSSVAAETTYAMGNATTSAAAGTGTESGVAGGSSTSAPIAYTGAAAMVQGAIGVVAAVGGLVAVI